MAFDEGLAQRLRELTEAEPRIVGEELMVRVGPDAYAGCLSLPHAREMDFTGRAMKGMIYVSTEGFEEDVDLEAWVERGIVFADSLPTQAAVRKAAKKVAKRGAKKSAKKSNAKTKR